MSITPLVVVRGTRRRWRFPRVRHALTRKHLTAALGHAGVESQAVEQQGGAGFLEVPVRVLVRDQTEARVDSDERGCRSCVGEVLRAGERLVAEDRVFRVRALLVTAIVRRIHRTDTLPTTAGH
jgi:hypothetical protein